MLERVPILLASLVALFVGPLVHYVLRNKPLTARVFHWLIAFAVGYLILTHVLPQTVGFVGPYVAWPLFFGGLLLPFVGEKLSGRHDHPHTGALTLGAIALFLHAITDGVALGIDLDSGRVHPALRGRGDSTLAMGLAVVLHRLPVGAAVYEIFREKSRKIALFAIFSIVVATLIGFFFGAPWLEIAGQSWVAGFQCFAGGVLMHVILHKHDHDHEGHGHGHGHSGHGHGASGQEGHRHDDDTHQGHDHEDHGHDAHGHDDVHDGHGHAHDDHGHDGHRH